MSKTHFLVQYGSTDNKLNWLLLQKNQNKANKKNLALILQGMPTMAPRPRLADHSGLDLAKEEGLFGFNPRSYKSCVH